MSKQLKKIRKKLADYNEKILETYVEFRNLMELYFQFGINSETEKITEKIAICEEEADAIRRNIIRYILQSDIMPTTMASFMNLSEMIDNIADKAEKISNGLILKSLPAEEIDINLLRNILSITENQLIKMTEAVDFIFEDYDKAFEAAHYLEIPEKEVDVIERVFMTHLKNSNIDLEKKIYYKELIEDITAISDLIEDVGDEIEKITILKRV